MSMEYIRKTYNVPAKRGGKIKWLYHSFTDGIITGSKGACLRIKLATETRSKLFHPTWMIEYL